MFAPIVEAIQHHSARVKPHRASNASNRGVGSIQVPLRIDRQKYEVDIAHGAGFVEPLEDCLSLAEARMYERERSYKPGFFAQGFFPVSLM